MRVVSIIVLAAVLASLAACRPADGRRTADHPPAVKPARVKSADRVKPDLALRGRVALVNAPARTVVLSFPLGWLPAPERRLNVYRQGVKVGEVKVTGPQMDTNIAADLIAGEAAPGDEVRED